MRDAWVISGESKAFYNLTLDRFSDLDDRGDSDYRVRHRSKTFISKRNIHCMHLVWKKSIDRKTTASGEKYNMRKLMQLSFFTFWDKSEGHPPGKWKIGYCHNQ